MGYHATQTLNQNLFIVGSCQWPELIIKFIWEEPTQCGRIIQFRRKRAWKLKLGDYYWILIVTLFLNDITLGLINEKVHSNS